MNQRPTEAKIYFSSILDLGLVTQNTRQQATIHMPFFLEAAILSRMRSPATFRSNWARRASVQGKPRHRGRGVELLGYRHEGDAPSVEGFDNFCKLKQRTRQTVNFVDHHHVDLASRISLKSRCRAGRSIVPPGKPPSSTKPARPPSFMLLGEDKGCAGFALGIERVKACSRPSSDDLRV